MSTLAELRFRAQELAGLVESETRLDTSPGDVDRFINSAYRLWLERYGWPFLREELEVVTTVDQSDYAPSTDDVTRVNGVLVREENYYRRLRPRDHTSFYTATEQGSGLPREYAVLDDAAVRLYPVPDKAYEMRVIVTVDPAPLEADDDVPAFPAAFHDGLALHAASRILRRRRGDGDVGRANDLDDEAAQLLETMRRRETLDHDPSRSVLGGRYDRHSREAFIHGAS